MPARLCPPRPIHKHQFWNHPSRPFRGDFMPSESSPLLIHEVVPLRKKITNQGLLQKREAFAHLLARLRNKLTYQHNSLTVFGILQVEHQWQVLEMPAHAASYLASLSYIQSLKIASVFSAKVRCQTPFRRCSTCVPSSSGSIAVGAAWLTCTLPARRVACCISSVGKDHRGVAPIRLASKAAR